MRILNKVKENFKDIYIMYGVFACIILFACHLIQFYNSNFKLEPLIHASMSFAFIICGSIFGKKSLSNFLFIDAIMNLFVIRFTNYTPFLLILIAIYIKPKYKLFYLSFYILMVFFRMWQLKDSFTHLAIHALTCSFFYFGLNILWTFEKNKNTKDLELENDEIKILDQLIQGKEKNDIDGFSEITVYRKIRNARERNDILTNDELIQKYKNYVKK